MKEQAYNVDRDKDHKSLTTKAISMISRRSVIMNSLRGRLLASKILSRTIIKHRHNVVRDTLVDICYRSGISAGKEVDIRLEGARDKPLRPDMLLYSWDRGLDRKRDKYMAKCTAIGYGFLPFSFSSLRELEADAVTLLKRIWKFSMAQDIGARATVY
ncbi:hypothetical protein Tco_0755395 [Tanacetum coccineum]